MTTDLSGYSDDALLAALADARERRGRIEQEIERRFADMNTPVIETEHWVATQRTDTTRFVFSEDKFERFMWFVDEGVDTATEVDAARQISRPYVSLSKKETTEERPL